MIYHILMLKFKEDTSPEEVKALCDEVLGLPKKCFHHTTKTHYVETLGGGVDHSIEGYQNGFTHCFLSKFNNEEDRKYYVEGDPAHLQIIDTLMPRLDKLQIMDFTPWQY
ncbi:stress responsive A/B barrel domain-containing protein [Nemania sp. NC0429]|nr:stress responsive A/B barrel domain-containing protein [Nemania sp. NC0429]